MGRQEKHHINSSKKTKKKFAEIAIIRIAENNRACSGMTGY